MVGSFDMVPCQHRLSTGAQDPPGLRDDRPWFPAVAGDPRPRVTRITFVRPGLLLIALAALALAGCGGGSQGPTTPTAQTQMQIVTVPNSVPHNTQPPPASATDEQVIRLWADTLRHGDVAGAAGMFALPTITQIQPGEPFLELRTRAQTQAFNRSLPCGAVLLRTERHQGLTVGVFRLSNRPGATCDGTGAIARTGFVIEHGRITHWIRLPNQPGDDATPPTPQTGDDQQPPLV
jgi:hypothetical protein